MRDRLEAAAKAVERFLAEQGASDAVFAYHVREIGQYRRHLEETGEDPTRESARSWVEDVASRFSAHKASQARVACGRLLEALEAGGVATPLPRQVGARKRLRGWSLAAVDSYASAMSAQFTEAAATEAAAHAAQFLVAAGLEDAAPSDLTARAVADYASGCPGTRCVRAQRLCHVRGFVAHLASKGEVPAWMAVAAREATLGKWSVLAPFDPPEAGGLAPDALAFACEGLVATMRDVGYAQTPIHDAGRAVALLTAALPLSGAGYTPANARAWLAAASASGALSESRTRALSRALGLIGRFVADGSLEPAGASARRDPCVGVPAWARGEVEAYLDVRRREGCAVSTLGCIARACARLASFAEARGVRSWGDLDARTVLDWKVLDPHATPAGRACYVAKAHGFLARLGELGVTDPGLALAAGSTCAPRVRVVEVLDDDRVLACRDARLAASSPLELRDAAMVALGLTMGLRASDVVGLPLSALDWRSSTLTLTQRKTGRAVTLPLTVPAGNALAAYLLRGRPREARGCPLVFVKERAPYDGLSRSACRLALRRTLGEGVPGGFHALRKTFASGMLRSGAGESEVSVALGHGPATSLAPYLSLDAEHMRMCALSPGDCGLGDAEAGEGGAS